MPGVSSHNQRWTCLHKLNHFLVKCASGPQAKATAILQHFSLVEVNGVGSTVLMFHWNVCTWVSFWGGRGQGF